MPISSPRYQPEVRHTDLGPAFYDPVAAARFPTHRLRYRNQLWAAHHGLGELTQAEWIDHFGRFQPLPNNLQTPLALRYHGHQFRVYNPDLGDGRGFLFAQLRDPDDGRLLDLGTKGSGQTPWSRAGDGRLTLKGAVREVLATTMLEALGVNTSKTFSVIETGEHLSRNDEPSPTRSAVLVRLCHGHIRIGTFQRLAFHGDQEGLRQLLHHTVRVHYPTLSAASDTDLALAFVRAVAERCAATTAGWMAAGFVHGVLNTDNINVTGESFDYGPYRFLPHYDPRFTAAYFDHGGLYAFGRQPTTLQWNLARLAGCLLDIAPAEGLNQALDAFQPAFEAALRQAVLWRLNLAPTEDAEADLDAVATWFQGLLETAVPFERAFFDWQGGAAGADRALSRSPHAALYRSEPFAAARAALSRFAVADPARQQHDYLARDRPVTLLYDEIEALWAPIARDDDWSHFEAKLDEIALLAAANRCGIAENRSASNLVVAR
ncbi:MAG: YdiU family protein [Alphaproteobacteria bacterium]|nr:YdiU family protein [Alphaproteobacteria bacterium]